MSLSFFLLLLRHTFLGHENAALVSQKKRHRQMFWKGGKEDGRVLQSQEERQYQAASKRSEQDHHHLRVERGGQTQGERGKGPEGGGRQLTVWRLETWRRWEEVCISPPFHFYSWWQRTAEGQDLPRARDCAKSFVWILSFDPHNISLRRHFYSP